MFAHVGSHLRNALSDDGGEGLRLDALGQLRNASICLFSNNGKEMVTGRDLSMSHHRKRKALGRDLEIYSLLNEKL